MIAIERPVPLHCYLTTCSQMSFGPPHPKSMRKTNPVLLKRSLFWKRSILGAAVILSAGLMLATGYTGGAKTADSGKRFRLSGFDAPPAVRGIVLRACA